MGVLSVFFTTYYLDHILLDANFNDELLFVEY